MAQTKTARDGSIPNFGLPQLDGLPLIQRHLACALHNAGNGSAWHRKEIIKALWPAPMYEWHRWNDRRLRGICSHDWVTWLGPGASAKTTDAAVFGLEYYLEAPHATAIIVCSTTMQMLKKRIWGQIVQYYNALPKNTFPPGNCELIDSGTIIRWEKGDQKNGIYGMAVEEGSVAEVLNNLIGIHTERVFLILDEMQGVREAIMKATDNMSKNPVFKFLGMGNPDSLLNPLGRESEPIGGWGSVIEAETEEWETLGGPRGGNGLCQFFDGRKSPADDSPEERKRLHYLINKDWIAGHVKRLRGNTKDPSFWAQSIGWPPPFGLENTVLDEAIVAMFNVRKPAVWTSWPKQWAALDPSFEGGDRKVLKFGKFGEVDDSMGKRWVIEECEVIDVPIDANNRDRPIHHQIVDFTKAECGKRNIPPQFFGLDSSGEGGGLKAIFDVEWGPVIGVEFGGKPSDDLVNSGDGKTCAEAYDRKATELQMQIREFAQSNGLRGVSEQAVKELCSRRTEYRSGKLRVEAKTTRVVAGTKVKGFKERLGYSPDDSEALAVGISVCRIHGAIASMSESSGPTPQEQVEELAESTGDFYSSDNYILAQEYP